MREHTCFECGESMEQDGRYTWYCPSCDVCPECGCELGGHTANCSELLLGEIAELQENIRDMKYLAKYCRSSCMSDKAWGRHEAYWIATKRAKLTELQAEYDSRLAA